ncbi:MAG: TetR/AcrR family transcriptional regulator [Dietzia sp.]|uniref:TetR/AcrR family transcriptional regulator n=1 Tax=Dietzia sp. E1 TaxID=328361 RepID=UPI0001F64ABA|nr:TetR/AcrR family transcriptional regulator [Dietzia sp. E1]EFV91892.1 TetR family transcriptional regulator [Dietzia cinnamea P4]MBB1021723.1 TetR/AcrR family transcriptional regulator [Dietzia sp. E1]MBC7306618.1 TetR/AcrR family transcriptional regulator [Dietzia sp.]
MTSPDRPVPAAQGRARAARLPRGARRSQLIDAAGTVFVEQGFHASGMDDIAVLAGVSKPVLYQHFDSKRDLYIEVLRHHVDALLGRIRAALDSTSDNRRRVEAAVDTFFAYADNDTRGFRLVFYSESGDEDVRRELDRATEGCIDAVHDLVRGDSGLDVHRSRLLAVGLVGASRVSAGHWLDAGRPIPREDAVSTTVTLCWGGLSKIPRHGGDRPTPEA